MVKMDFYDGSSNFVDLEFFGGEIFGQEIEINNLSV